MATIAVGTLSDNDKLLKAREYKERGNAAYKDGNYRQAAGSYHRAILQLKGLSSNCPDLLSRLKGLPESKAELSDEAKLLTCDCYNNLAACMLKDPNPKYDRIIEHCNAALNSSPDNTKALFRKGTSLYALRRFEEAIEVFETVNAELEPSFKKYIDLCKAEIKKADKMMAAKLKDMFR